MLKIKYINYSALKLFIKILKPIIYLDYHVILLIIIIKRQLIMKSLLKLSDLLTNFIYKFIIIHHLPLPRL